MCKYLEGKYAGNPLIYRVIPSIKGVYESRIEIPHIDQMGEDVQKLNKMKEAHLIAKSLCIWGGGTTESDVGVGYEFYEHEYEAFKTYLNRNGFAPL